MRRSANARLEARAAIASPRGHGLIGAVCGLVVALGALGVMAVPAAVAASCPNEAIRAQQGSTDLPECRAYELVSPAEKGGASVLFQRPENQVKGSTSVSTDGRHALYWTILPFPGASTGLIQAWVSTRVGSGWTYQQVTPEPGVTNPEASNVMAIFNQTADFAQLFGEGQGAAPVDPPDLHPDMLNGYQRDALGRWSLMAPETNGWSAGAFYVGNSADGTHVLFTSQESVGPTAPKHPGYQDLYVRANGSTELVDVDNEGNLLSRCGATLGYANSTARGQQLSQAVSTDGSRIVFSTPSSGSPSVAECGSMPIRVYLRDAGRTIDVSASQRTPAAPAASSYFWGANEDASRIFFYSSGQLTDDAASGGGLYRFDLGDLSLHFLTPPVSGEAKLRNVVRVAPDGRRVYFTASGQLDPSSPLPSGEEGLYVWSETGVHLIAAAPASAWTTGNGSPVASLEKERSAMLSPDGTKLAFALPANLTAYDSGGSDEVYLYDDLAKTLTCASCPAVGVPAVGDAALPIQGSAAIKSRSQEPIARAVLDDGRVFFETPQALAAQDSNARTDVYEYDKGRQLLLSGGTGVDVSNLLGVSDDGNSVFFTTGNTLVPQDFDNGDIDVYDTRVGGGFAMPSPASECAGDACQGEPAAAPAPTRVGSTVVAAPSRKRRRAVRKRCSAPAARGHEARQAAKRRCAKAKKARRKGHHRRRQAQHPRAWHTKNVTTNWRIGR